MMGSELVFVAYQAQDYLRLRCSFTDCSGREKLEVETMRLSLLQAIASEDHRALCPLLYRAWRLMKMDYLSSKRKQLAENIQYVAQASSLSPEGRVYNLSFLINNEFTVSFGINAGILTGLMSRLFTSLKENRQPIVE